MGYHISFNLYISKSDKYDHPIDVTENEEIARIIKEIRESDNAAEMALDEDGSCKTDISNWDVDSVFKPFSKKYPDYVFCVTGSGDGLEDTWEAWYYNGKEETNYAEIKSPKMFAKPEPRPIKVYNRVKSKPYIHLQNNYRNLKKRYRKLEKEFQQYKYESVGWCADDILAQADNDDIKISKRQAQKVLEYMISKHDASLGITWDTISIYLQQWQSDPKRFN